MAREKSPWQRFQEKERQREEEEERRKKKREANTGFIQVDELTMGSLDVIMHKAQVLIEQVDSLYHQYLIGIERRPPVEKRSQLEKYMGQISRAPKTTPQVKFRAESLQSSFNTRRDKWDRKLKELEAGKIHRPGKPGK